MNTIKSLLPVFLVLGLYASAAEPPRGPDPFRDAVAVWHMNGLKDPAGKNELKVVGAVTTGVKLQGKELEASQASGNDGLVARLEGGYLDAGQGTDGTSLQMFVDGVLMCQANPEGPVREGNTEPCLIGAESNDGRINSGWQGLIDHAAIWNRALTDAEIEQLSGGAARVAALKLVYLIKSRDYRKLGEKSPLEIRTEGGDVKFNRLEVYPLKSIH